MSALVSHVDDERDWTEFGDDAVWYLHKQTVAEGAAATVRCGLFRVAPAPSELTLPYHETIVTLAGEGTTTVAGEAVEIAPGRQLFLEAGAAARFAPRSTNVEFITVVEVGTPAPGVTAGDAPADGAAEPAIGIAVLDGAEPALLDTAAASPAVTAGTVRLAAGEHAQEDDADRSLVVLDGAGELQLPDGDVRQLRAGTIAFLPRGQRVTWRVGAELRAFVTAVR